MPDTKISALPAATSATGTDELEANQSGTSRKVTLAQIAAFFYPVGSLYLSTASTNPATILGMGTWAAFGAGRVMVGLDAGDTDFDLAEETGGAKTVASAGTVSQPTFSGSALGTHSHGVGTYATSAHAGTAVGDHASHTHDYTQVLNHTHTVDVTDGGHSHTQRYFPTATGGSIGYTVDTSMSGTQTNATLTTASATTGITAATQNPAGGVVTGTTTGPSAILTHSVTQPSAHTLSGSSEAVSAGTPAGTVSTPTFTGSATSVVQPYIVIYAWKRTA